MLSKGATLQLATSATHMVGLWPCAADVVWFGSETSGKSNNGGHMGSEVDKSEASGVGVRGRIIADQSSKGRSMVESSGCTQ